MPLEIADMLNRLLGRPVFVGIDEQNGLAAGCSQRLLHDADAPQVALAVQPDLELADANAAPRLTLVELADFVIAEGEVNAAGIGFDGAAAGAQGLPQRFVVGFGFQVPQRQIQRADDIGDGAAVAAFEGEIGHAPPQADHAARVAADKQILRHGVDIALLPGVAQAHAGQPIVSFQEDRQPSVQVAAARVISIANGAIHAMFKYGRANACDFHVYQPPSPDPFPQNEGREN